MTTLLPPMGWNSWNTFAENVNEKTVLSHADALVKRGLADYGYRYVIIDDCWALKERSKDGKLVADPEKFPRGMKFVADELHKKGFKFGMYSCSGLMTCARYPSSMDREWTDAKTFAEWGVDYLKYDYCFKPYNRRGEDLYRAMGLALANCGREILFSACNWGADETQTWIRTTGADMWRSTGDIFDNWSSVKSLIQQQFDLLPYGGKGCFNDMDMLIVGMYNKGHVGLGGCTQTEYRTHFAAWCMLQSPLIIGANLETLDDFSIELLKNNVLLSIDQDNKCAQTYILNQNNEFARECPILVRALENGDLAIGFFNLSDEQAFMQCTQTDMSLPLCSGKTFELTNCWTGEKIRPRNGVIYMDLAAHDCVVYRAKVVEA